MSVYAEFMKAFEKFNLETISKPQLYPNISEKTKKKLIKNIDGSISPDSFIAVYNASLIRKCKVGLFFTLSGIYISGKKGEIQYTDYLNIKYIIIGSYHPFSICGNKTRVLLILKDDTMLLIDNFRIINQHNFKYLMEELIRVRKTQHEINNQIASKTYYRPDLRKKYEIIIHSAVVDCEHSSLSMGFSPSKENNVTAIQIRMIISLASLHGLRITEKWAYYLLVEFISSWKRGALNHRITNLISSSGKGIDITTMKGSIEAVGWYFIDEFFNKELEYSLKYFQEDQKKKYKYVRNEYENKLKIQAELFETGIRSFKNEIEGYEELLHDYESYIIYLESASDLSESDRFVLEDIKKEYDKLRKFRVGNIQTKISTNIDTKMFAPCGMNCSVCYKRYDIKTGKSCGGCLSESEYKPKHCHDCKIKKCVLLKGISYCFECSEFPCKKSKKLEKCYNRYSESLIENSKFVKHHGISKFIETHLQKYTCPECGTLISIHERECIKCGRVIEN